MLQDLTKPTADLENDPDGKNEEIRQRRRTSKASSVRSNLVNSALLSAIGLSTSFFVIRQIGASEKGVYSFLLLFSTFLMPMLAFGVNTGSLYLISCNAYRIRDTLFSCFLFGVLHGCLTAGIVLILWSLNLLGRIGNELSLSIILPVMLTLPMKGSVSAMEAALMGDGQFRFINFRSMIDSIVTSLLMWSLVILLDLRLQGIIAIMVAVAILNVSILTYSCWNLYHPLLRIDYNFLRDAFRYGVKSMLGFFSKRANLRLDHVIIGFVGSPGMLGIYSVASMIAEMLWKVENSVGVVFFKKIAETKDSMQRSELLSRVIRMSMLLSSTIALPLIFVCHLLIPWGFGAEFKAVTPLLIVLLPGTILGGAFRTINRFFGATGNLWLMSLGELVALVFAVMFYWPLIQLFGLMGAAVASTLVYGFGAIASLHLLGKHYDGSTRVLLKDFSLLRDVKWVISQLRRQN